MLNVHLRIFLGALLIVGISACGKNQAKKQSLSRSNQNRAETSEWSTNKQLYTNLNLKAGTANCFNLPALVTLIESVGAGLVSIHASDLDFVEVSGDLTTQKAAYFFKDGPGKNKEAFYEVMPAADIRKPTSKQVGRLLADIVQPTCDQVAIGGEIFVITNATVSKSSELRLTNAGTGERRNYMMLNRGQILVSVTKAVKDVPRCGLVESERTVRKSYIISRGNGQGRAPLASNFARFLENAVYALPELKLQLDAQAERSKKQEKVTPRSQIVSDRVNVSYQTLTYLAFLIKEGQGTLSKNDCRP